MKQPSGPGTMVAALCVLLALVPASIDAQQATVRGTVVVAGAGTRVPGALVLLLNRGGQERQQVRTDSAGAFSLAVPAAGMYQLTVLSDEPPGAETTALQVSAGDDVVLDVRLGAALFQLSPISVVGRRPVVTERVRNFRERAQLNRALGLGRIFTREDVEALRPRTAEMLLGVIPTSRCDPQIRLDGLPASRADLRTVPTGNLEGMEVYMGTEVPREFEDRSACGVVLVWTRSQPEGMRQMGGLYILVSGLLSAATFLIMR
jgi:hypothetical protein